MTWWYSKGVGGQKRYMPKDLDAIPCSIENVRQQRAYLFTREWYSGVLPPQIVRVMIDKLR